MTDQLIQESKPVFCSPHDPETKFTDKQQAADHHWLLCIQHALEGLFMGQGKYRIDREKKAHEDAVKLAPLFFKADKVGLVSFDSDQEAQAKRIAELNPEQADLAMPEKYEKPETKKPTQSKKKASKA